MNASRERGGVTSARGERVERVRDPSTGEDVVSGATYDVKGTLACVRRFLSAPPKLPGPADVATERDARAMDEAVAALARGERALGEKNAKAAIEALSKIETLVPREYKLNQRAGLLLSEAYKLAGDNARYLEYKNRVWWWGRGLRWPGWYIIAYLSARSAYFDAKEDDEAAFSMSEAGVVAPLWVGLLFLLVEYGLPDY